MGQESIERPTTHDKSAWTNYWKAQGQPWRIEPEIHQERQRVLNDRRSIVPDLKQGIYPFKDIDPPLNRADLEWLLSTHGNTEPRDEDAERQQARDGLDMRGADLQEVDLSYLPLARLRGSLSVEEWDQATREQRQMAAVNLRRANLEGTNLQGAILRGIRLDNYLHRAHLEDADLTEANLSAGVFTETYLRGTQLSRAHMITVILDGAHLEEATLNWADIGWHASLLGAHLERAKMVEADLHTARLRDAHLEGADLRGANLCSADLRHATLDAETQLEGVILSDEQRRHIGPWLADVWWGGAALTKINWDVVQILRDEYEASKEKMPGGKFKDAATRLAEFQAAERAYRQLATVLQEQGLYQAAQRFAERAHMMSEQAYRWEAESR